MEGPNWYIDTRRTTSATAISARSNNRSFFCIWARAPAISPAYQLSRRRRSRFRIGSSLSRGRESARLREIQDCRVVGVAKVGDLASNEIDQIAAVWLALSDGADYFK